MLERALTLAGHEVTVATNGRSALQILEAGAFDLVLTDIVMPEMEGLELIRTIRKQSPAPKIISMSGGGRGAVSMTTSSWPSASARRERWRSPST